MKVLVPQELLAEGLSTVSKAVSAKNTIPVLSGIYLEARSGHLLLRATDLELAMERTIKVSVLEEGAVVLPARYLTDLVRRIPFGDLEITVDLRNYTATLRWQKSQYMIHGFPADQFPHVPEPDASTAFSMAQPFLRDVLRQTAFAAAHDETRPYLTGVHLSLKGDELSAVATDSVRIAHSRTSVRNTAGVSTQAIVPGRSLNELARVLSGEPEAVVQISVTNNQIFFGLGDLRVISRLLEGQYPDVLRLIPQQYSTKVKINKVLFLEAIERAALITKDNAIKLGVTADLLTITSNTPEVGQVYEEIPVELQGEPLEIGFNARFLMEGLKTLDDQEFYFDFSGNRNPSRISASVAENFLYVVLPLITY